MIRPSSSSKIRLDRRPMASSTSVRRPGWPKSSVTSSSSRTSRSRGGWVMAATRPPTRCLRSSIQNMGGSAGLSRVRPVSWMRGALAPAFSSSRLFPRSSRITWSRAGCWTLSIRRPSRTGRSSSATACIQTPSNGMVSFLHHHAEELVDPLPPALQVQPAQQRFQGRGLAVLGPGGVAGHRLHVGVPPTAEHGGLLLCQKR